MKVLIRYKTDHSSIPYCAYIEQEGFPFMCEWSAKSFEAARDALLARLHRSLPPIPPPEEVDIGDKDHALS